MMNGHQRIYSHLHTRPGYICYILLYIPSPSSDLSGKISNLAFSPSPLHSATLSARIREWQTLLCQHPQIQSLCL